MGTSSISKINRLVDTLLKSELEISLNKNLLFLLIYLDRHPKVSFKNLEDKIKLQREHVSQYLDRLLSKKLINKDTNGLFYVSQEGKSFLNPIYYSKYKLGKISGKDIEGYTIESELGQGSTSVTFKAVKEKTGRTVVLKIIKPGMLDHIDIFDRIKNIAPLGDDYLVVPCDYGDFNYQDIQLKYFEMEYVQGKTLREFLNNKIHFEIEPFLTHFIKEVGGVLCRIQSKGFQHGDLHLNNVMVTEDVIHRGKYHFKIIDFIGVNSKEQFKEYEYSDMEYFRKNFLLIVDHILLSSGESEKRTLGEKLFQIYNEVLNNEYASFDQIIKDLSKEYISTESVNDKIEKPFNIFIFEQYDISDPKWLKIFEPDVDTYERLKSFNNVIISGPRGCGKTIYLKSLSFIPDLIEKIKKEEELKPLIKKYSHYKEIFGIFFPCRQAEFKIISDKYVKYTPSTELFIKHIFVLKIIKKTLSLIGRGYVKNIFRGTFVYEDIMDFMTKYLSMSFGLMGDGNELSELSEILDNEETVCLNLLGQEGKYPLFGNLLNENKLIEFFDIINKSISELQNARFYIIFDDVSDPNISFETQRILNSIVRTTNSKYCFKISTEKYGYDFSDMDGKILESPHDFDYIDLATFGRAERDSYSKRMRDYLGKVVDSQLITAGYQKNKKITDYLDKLPYSHDELIKLLSGEEKDKQVQEAGMFLKEVKYGGWEIICHLSSGSVRVVLQICDSIFKACEVTKKSQLKTDPQATISIDIQDEAIRKFSREEYANLINIKNVGKRVFDIVRNFGQVSRDYLTQEITKEEGRKHEVISIERSDNDELSKKAEEMLHILLRHSIFTDIGLSFSRTQIGLVQKFTLHKRFCPTLKTTFRERERLRLSKDQLELLLLSPDKFAKEGTEFLRRKNNGQLRLF